MVLQEFMPARDNRGERLGGHGHELLSGVRRSAPLPDDHAVGGIVVAAFGVGLLQPLWQLVLTAVVLALDYHALAAQTHSGYVASVL